MQIVTCLIYLLVSWSSLAPGPWTGRILQKSTTQMVSPWSAAAASQSELEDLVCVVIAPRTQVCVF